MDEVGLGPGAAALLFLSALASCTEVDNRLGESLIPDDQQMKIKVDTVYGIDTYLAKTDSFPRRRDCRTCISARP